MYGWTAQSWAHLIVQSSVLYLEPLKQTAEHSRASARRALGAEGANQWEGGRCLDRLLSELGHDGHTVLHAELGVNGEVMVRVDSDNPAILPRIREFATDAVGATGGNVS